MTLLFAFLLILLVPADNNSGLDHYQFLFFSQKRTRSQVKWNLFILFWEAFQFGRHNFPQCGNTIFNPLNNLR